MEQRAQPPCSPACDHHTILSPPAERLQGKALHAAGPWPYICALEISEFILPQGILTSLLIFKSVSDTKEEKASLATQAQEQESRV